VGKMRKLPLASEMREEGGGNGLREGKDQPGEKRYVPGIRVIWSQVPKTREGRNSGVKRPAERLSPLHL